MTYLVVPIFGDSIEQIRRDIAEAVEFGADLIELRVDRMPEISDEEIRSLLGNPIGDIPMILTIRSADEGGDWSESEADRIERLLTLAPLVDFTDVELVAWRDSDDALRQLRSLILSKHDFTGRPSSLHSDLFEMLAADGCKTPKLAWRARTVRDNFEAFELMRTCASAHTPTGHKPGIIVCIGSDGLPSRILAKKFGAFATFGALASGRESAPGQVTISEFKNLYRWDTIDERTHVYGVLGDPVAHSLSPHVHNAAFEQAGLNAVYLPLRVGAGYEAFKAFMVEVSARPWLDFAGFSVTIPHKENALRWIKEVGGKIDETAAQVGAVNTIISLPDGSPEGHNTDCPAALDTIALGLRRSMSDLADVDVAVLGAGGVARAVVAGLTSRGAQITIFNRSEAKAKTLAEEFGCVHAPWEQRHGLSASLIVNCTSVGLWPDIEVSPLDGKALKSNQAVFDTIYNPLQTKLLREAAGQGCPVMDGMTMFARQAQSQFELWTRKILSHEFFREVAASFIMR